MIAQAYALLNHPFETSTVTLARGEDGDVSRWAVVDVSLALSYSISYHHQLARTFPLRISPPDESSAFIPRLREQTDRPTGYSPSFLPTRGLIGDVPTQRRISFRRIQIVAGHERERHRGRNKSS